MVGGQKQKCSAAASSGKREARLAMDRDRARRRTSAGSGLYSDLAALLPGLPARATKVQILEEAVAYVEAMRAKVADLETRRAAAAAGRRSRGAADMGGAGPVVASVEAASCFTVRLPAAPPRRTSSLTRVLEVFQGHGVAVLAASVTTDCGETTVTVTTSAVAPSVVEKIKADISDNIRVASWPKPNSLSPGVNYLDCDESFVEDDGQLPECLGEELCS